MLDKTLDKDIYQRKMLQAIKNCGVSFAIWQKQDEDGNITNKYDWTSMMGTDKKKLLKSLPDHFVEFLPEASVNKVTQIWQVTILSWLQLAT